MEQAFSDSALARASMYAAYGLYDEALLQVERLAQLNPRDPQIERMRESLHRRLSPN